MNFSGRLGNLSNELGYLTWNEYPFECLPPSFELDNPVRLLLPNSNIKQLWEGMKPLQSTQFETFDSLIPKIQLRCQILGRP
ncbi:hypothetical protein AAZX31_12G153100 [Glycine max]